MQPIPTKSLLHDRQEAGYHLSKALNAYKNSNAIVMAFSPGGAKVAAVIAELLSLPLQLFSCRKIKHPADVNKSIGSVSVDDIYMNECSDMVPQDYIYHQIILLRNAIAYDMKKHGGLSKAPSIRYRPVILVDDVTDTPDSVMACLRSIKKQNPSMILFAVPIISTKAEQEISNALDDIKYIRKVPAIESPGYYFHDYLRGEEVKFMDVFNKPSQTVLAI